MQNAIQKFRQNSIVLEKPGILSENLKTLTSSNYPTVQYFLLKLRTRFLLTNVYKRVCGIFLFYLDLELFAKIKKDLVSTHSFFTLLLITQDLNKIKKIPHILLQTLLSRKRVQSFSKKYQSLSQLELVKVFNFSDKKPGFFEIIRSALIQVSDFAELDQYN